MNDREQAAASTSETAVTSAAAEDRPRAYAADDRAKSAGAVEAAAAEIAAELQKLDFGVAKSIRYQAKRRAFFDGLHRAAKVATVFTAASVFLAVIGKWPEVAKWVSVFVGAFSFVDLVVGFPERARKHDDLGRRFSNLAMEIARTSTAASQTDINELRVKRLQIEADEPTSLDVLNVICHNIEAEARGYGQEHQYFVPTYARLAAPVCSLQWRLETLAERSLRKARRPGS